jgi:hypothetical protein
MRDSTEGWQALLILIYSRKFNFGSAVASLALLENRLLICTLSTIFFSGLPARQSHQTSTEPV